MKKPRKSSKKTKQTPREPREQPLLGRLLRPKPTDIVSFTVLCQPRSGVGLAEFKRLRADNVQQFLPLEATKVSVINSLKRLGFVVYNKYPGPVVSASGPWKQFEDVFQTKLLKVQRIDSSDGARIRQDYYVIDPSASAPDVRVVPGAIWVDLVEPPVSSSAFPPSTKKSFRLRHAVDIGIATRAALVHRQVTSIGERATGAGVRVAVVDAGFHLHAYFIRNGYNLVAEVAEGAGPPALTDPDGHGTRMAANVFSCAPDATVIGIKGGADRVAALNCAMAMNPDVISCSWLVNLANKNSLPTKHQGLLLTISNIVAGGVPMVFGAGNDGQVGFPAMMPDVIAVGGVAVHPDESIEVWSRSSSFVSPIFPGRDVPDICGVASEMASPTAPDNGAADQAPWRLHSGGTSAATAQVAGIIALLRQKRRQLSPQQLKSILMASATDVTSGKSANNHVAGPNGDLATGAGLVDAFDAWNSVQP